MPRAVVEAGLSDQSVPLERLAAAILERHENRRVLVVDDSALTRRSLRQILEHGMRGVEAEDGLAALEHTPSRSPRW